MPPHPCLQNIKKIKQQKQEKQLQIIGVVNFKTFVSPQGIYNQVRMVIHKPLKNETRNQDRKTSAEQ